MIRTVKRGTVPLLSNHLNNIQSIARGVFIDKEKSCPKTTTIWEYGFATDGS
jgi:hypothetical protein